MKKVFVCLLAVSVVLSVATFAQDASKTATADNAAAAPVKNIRGTIKAEGDKTTFVAGKDQKSWDIMNPEAVKGHEGHHVQLSAHVYADKNAIHVMSVKMLAEKKGKMNHMQ